VDVPGHTDHAAAGGPEATNVPLTGTVAVDLGTYHDGDLAKDMLIYSKQHHPGAKDVGNPLQQMYSTMGIGQLNWNYLHNPKFAEHDSVLTEPWRLQGVQITDPGTMRKEHRNSQVLTVTRAGRHGWMPNIWSLTANRAVLEGDRLMILVIPFDPVSNPALDPVEFAHGAAAAVRAADTTKSIFPPEAPPMRAAAWAASAGKVDMHDMYRVLKAARPDGTQKLTNELFDAVTGAESEKSLKAHRPCWVRIPYVSVNGSEPDVALLAAGGKVCKVEYVGTVLHVNRGMNNATSEQRRFAEEVVLPASQGKGYWDAWTKLDRIEVSIRN